MINKSIYSMAPLSPLHSLKPSPLISSEKDDSHFIFTTRFAKKV